jgi:creatinine amidohydrolase/Fe(II)-dependent formamide hydrolase-like protein
VRLLAERIARALGHTLVAPVIAYVPEGRISPPSGHMRFPGTISVPGETFERVLESAGP